MNDQENLDPGSAVGGKKKRRRRRSAAMSRENGRKLLKRQVDSSGMTAATETVNQTVVSKKGISLVVVSLAVIRDVNTAEVILCPVN